MRRIVLTTATTALFLLPSGVAASRAKPIQHGRADGFSVAVYRSGVIVFRALSKDAPAYRLLAGTKVSAGCLKFRTVKGSSPNEWSVWKPFAAELYVNVTGHGYAPKPPYDACEIHGSYGNRWNDGHSRHAPVEVAFNDPARRFFTERATARDLAYFVRSPQLATIRKAMKGGDAAPAAAQIAHRYATRVVALQHANDRVQLGKVGVWTDGGDLIVASERASDGKRLFVQLRRGRISRHDLQGLAFAF